MKFLATLATAALVTYATAQTVTRCGTDDAPDHLKIAIPEVQTLSQPKVQYVDVYAHVVETQAKAGTYTEDEVNTQIDIMNQAYADSHIQFNLIDLDFAVNDAWAASSQGSIAERRMKSALHQGTYADLNLYFLSDLGDSLLGFCYFPIDGPSAAQVTLDGCVILAGTLPGTGEFAGTYDMGLTAVHEAGHYFGLFHVFQGNSCTGPGDYVTDTPRQKTLTDGCPRRKDSCPGKPGLDNIHNYMDYSLDRCLTLFTPRQGTRMNRLYNLYRAGL